MLDPAYDSFCIEGLAGMQPPQLTSMLSLTTCALQGQGSFPVVPKEATWTMNQTYFYLALYRKNVPPSPFK